MTALCDWGGEVEVALALARRFPGGEWDTSLWDESEWEQTDTALGDWLDVTCDTGDPIELKAGSSKVEGVIDRWEAATVSLSLYGAQYDPRTGQWSGLLTPGLPVRIRWRPIGEDDWRIAFLGTVADAGYKWDPQTLTAILDCDDGTAELVAYDQLPYEVPMGDGDRASERISRLADLAQVNPALRDITAGGVDLLASDLAGHVWEQMLDVADSDLGLVWLRRDGRLAYRPGGRVREIVDTEAELSACPIDEGRPEAIQYTNLRHADPTVLRNEVTVSRGKPFVTEGDPDPPDPPIVQRWDDPSIARFRPHSYKRTDLLHSDDTWSVSLADAIIANGAWPTTAPLEVQMDTLAADDIRIASVLLGVEPEHVFTIWDALEPDTSWRTVAHGWDVSLGRINVEGSVFVSDVSGWGAAGEWDDDDPDNAGWDVSAWALTGVDPAPARKDQQWP